MTHLSLTLLGTPRIEVDSHPIEINRRKAVALLAYLAVTRRHHSRDALATMLWPEADQARARAALRSALWAINTTALADWLAIDAETVTLTADAEHTLYVDAALFRELLDGGQNHNHVPGDQCDVCLDSLTQAVALYQNDFMAGFTLADAPDFDEWQFFQADGLRQKLAAALAALIEIHRARNEFGSAIPYARRYVALDPLYEPAQRTLMQLYAQDGQQSAALRQYERCRQTLDAELGVEPAAETETLIARIRRGAWKMGAEEAAHDAIRAVAIEAGIESGTTTAANPHNLPPASSPLIGRERELIDVATFLDDQTTRLLTITGPGGIGKTRLALAAAAEQVAKTNFPDGIYFVPLASVSDLEGIVPAIAEVVGYHLQSDQRPAQQQLVDYLHPRSLLLLLDNLEQLLSGEPTDGAALVAELLQDAPRLKILTTSRERLNLYEEQRYPLHGLALAEGGANDAGTTYAAATLFLQRARMLQPDFELAPADAPALAAVCRLVEGMPLALELVASRAEMLSLPEIAAEIQVNLDLLATDLRNVPDRHRSMQAVFDASWQSLDETEQRTYAQLSVFRGGFDYAAAKAITGTARQTLGGLVNKSLLRYNQRGKRYEFHELLRQYAAEYLTDDGDVTRDRHAAYYCALLEQREVDLQGPRQHEALAEIETDRENVRAAWQWAVGQSAVTLLENALTPLARFYHWQGRLQAGDTVCRLAVEKLTAPLINTRDELLASPWTPALAAQARTLVHLLTWQSVFNINLHQYADARHALAHAQRLLDAPELVDQRTGVTHAFLLLQRANLASVSDFGGNAIALLAESLACYRAADDAWGAARVLDSLGQQYMNLGQHEKARQLQQECLAIRERLGDQRGIARTYNVLGLLVLHIGQIEESEAYLCESLARFRTMNNPADLAAPLAVLGINQLFGGKFEECIVAYEESWAIHRALGVPRGPFLAEVTMTRARINLGHYAEALAQADADLAKFRAMDHPWSIAFTLYNLARIDLVEDAADQAHLRLLESAKILQAMNEKSLLPDALFCLAYAHRALGDRAQFVQTMVQALDLVIETGPLNPMRFELPGMALLLADAGEHVRAVEMYAAAQQSPYIANSRWFADFAGKPIAAMSAALSPDVVAAARERGQARDLWLTAHELRAELSEEKREIR